MGNSAVGLYLSLDGSEYVYIVGLNIVDISLLRLLSISRMFKRFCSSNIFPFKLNLSPGDRSEIIWNLQYFKVDYC